MEVFMAYGLFYRSDFIAKALPAGRGDHFNPLQPRDDRGRWTDAGGRLADIGGRGGGPGRGRRGQSPHICERLITLDGVICLYRCANGEIKRYNAMPNACPNVIIFHEGESL